MALPPKSPINKTQGYFDFLKDKTSNNFAKFSLDKEHAFILNLNGLDNLLDEYNNINFENVALCLDFSKAFNLWATYVGCMKSLTKKFWLDTKSMRISQTAVASKKADEKSVANGNRFANKDENVVNARYTENDFESFYGMLENLEEFLIRCHYEIKLFCDLESMDSIGNSKMYYSNKKLPLPPSDPLNYKKFTYLRYFALTVNKDFEKYGVELNFSGLTDTCMDYIYNDCKNIQKASKISREFNMWANYIDSLEGVTKKLYLDSETAKTNQIAIASHLHGGKNKAHGERLANMDERVINSRKTRNSFDAFHECLEVLEQFLIRSHHETRFFAKIYNTKVSEGVV